MVAPYFLPRRRVGALRPFKFAIHLKEFGWEPHILTIASDGQLTPKEQQLLGDINVHALKPPFDRTGRSGSQLKKSEQDEGSQNSTFSIGDWIDKHFPVDTWWPFFGLKLPQIKEIVNRIQPNALWSTGDPWSAHWVGKKIAEWYPGICWVADFRDPWTLSATDLKKRSSFAAWMDRKIERRWIQQPSMLSFTTDSTKELYQQHYSALDLPATTIYNAFDRELFNEPDENSTTLDVDSQKLNLIFFGRFRRLSPARPIIDVLAELKKDAPGAVEKITVHSFGPLSDSDSSYLEEKGLTACFRTHDPVPVEQGLQVLQQADLLLLSTSLQRTDIIPAKLWDYLAAAQPILSIAPNPEIKKILDETGTGIQLSAKELKKIAELLRSAVQAKEKGEKLPIPFSNEQAKIDRYSAKKATQKLASILEEHTG